MKKIQILKIILLGVSWIISNPIYPQTKIPLPTDKSRTYEQHRLYFDSWSKDIKNYENITRTNDAITHKVMAIQHHNRFMTYYKMLPDNSSDILSIFFDAFSFDKHYFCNSFVSSVKNIKWANA